MRTARRLVFSVMLVLASAGCDAIIGEPPEDDTVEPPPEEPPADELEARLREQGREDAPYMVREGDAMRGEGTRDFSRVLHPGWCYKVVGFGAEGISDLDVRVYDPNGVLLQRDTTQSPTPLVGRMRPICPPESGTYRIELRVIEGEGEYAAQLYRSI